MSQCALHNAVRVTIFVRVFNATMFKRSGCADIFDYCVLHYAGENRNVHCTMPCASHYFYVFSTREGVSNPGGLLHGRPPPGGACHDACARRAAAELPQSVAPAGLPQSRRCA